MADFLLLTIIFLYLQRIRAANTWIPHESIEYMYVSHCRSLPDSASYCQSIGGQLASATTVDQRKFIVQQVYDGQTEPSGSCATWHGAYLGGEVEELDAKTALIKWFDGTVTAFHDSNNPIDWDTNEPNNLNRHTAIGFKLSTRLWHTVYPGENNVQICQRTITTSIPTTHNPTTVPSENPTQPPLTSAPTTYNPTTHNPTTLIPTTSSLTTSAPTTSASTTSPTTSIPTTSAPTTSAPTSSSPTTSIPTSIPTSVPTSVPTTSTPTTSIPTQQPTTVAPTTTTNTFIPVTSISTLIQFQTTSASDSSVTSLTVTSRRNNEISTMAERSVMEVMETTLSETDMQSMEQGQSPSNSSVNVHVINLIVIIGAVASILVCCMASIIFIFARNRKNKTKAAASPIAAPNMTDNNLFGVMHTNLHHVQTKSEGNEGADTNITMGGPMPESYKKHMTKPSTFSNMAKCSVDTPQTVDSEALYTYETYEIRDHITKGNMDACLEVIDDDDDEVINDMEFGKTLQLQISSKTKQLPVPPPRNNMGNINILPAQIMVRHDDDDIKHNENNMEMENTPMTAVSEMDTPICYDMTAVVTIRTPVGVVDTLTAIIQKHKNSAHAINEEQMEYTYTDDDCNTQNDEEEDD